MSLSSGDKRGPSDLVKRIRAYSYADADEVERIEDALVAASAHARQLMEGSRYNEAARSSTPHIKFDPKGAQDALLEGATKRQANCAHGNTKKVARCIQCVIAEAVAVIVELHNEWAADLLDKPVSAIGLKWIPVRERRPEGNQDVLCVTTYSPAVTTRAAGWIRSLWSEVESGIEKECAISHWAPMPSGPTDDGAKEKTCPSCKGSGERQVYDTTRGPHGDSYEISCEVCGGTGVSVDSRTTTR